MGKIYNMHLYETIMAGIEQAFLNENSRDEYKTYKMKTGPEIKHVYIGDPGYILEDDTYFDVLIPMVHGKTKKLQYGVMPKEMGIVHSTWVGDGGYASKTGKVYPVDAGMLSICMAENPLCSNPNFKQGIKKFDIGKGPHEITMKYQDGTFIFIVDDEIIEEIYTKPDYKKEDKKK